jgi:PAS domain-containing protein
MNCNNTKNLQSFLGNIGVATMIFNADAVVTACNSASEKLLGLPDGGLVGCTLAELELFFVDAAGNVDTKDGFPVNQIAADQKEAT